MWIATEHGFYSAVENRHKKNTVIIRARVKEDLEKLVASVKGSKRRKLLIESTPSADYPFRVTLRKTEWADFLSSAAQDIDYPNFKNRVAKHDAQRSHVYHDVWATLMKLEKREAQRWTQELLPLDEAALDDQFDPDMPYMCQFCDETLVGFYEQCPWCGEALWDYEDTEINESLW